MNVKIGYKAHRQLYHDVGLTRKIRPAVISCNRNTDRSFLPGYLTVSLKLGKDKLYDFFRDTGGEAYETQGIS